MFRNDPSDKSQRGNLHGPSESLRIIFNLRYPGLGKFLTPRKTCGFILRIQISKSDIWQVAASTLIGYVWSLTLLSGEKIVRNHHERRVYICMYIYRPQGDQNADEDEEKASTASAKARRNDAELNGSRSWPSPR
ncbi:uncharacterized protein LOC105257552 isoform X2 [Camponotus floridanus]|uniref:uncharacterized protein LOC105257552 isoform X2 n=1 Tax=Camponotus floridanus TaxID=104421 RepID=UPI000DC69DD6|nr:uncharacterized protein LOC105257552 isoform X2 [Camponotus floridanus]